MWWHHRVLVENGLLVRSSRSERNCYSEPAKMMCWNAQSWIRTNLWLQSTLESFWKKDRPWRGLLVKNKIRTADIVARFHLVGFRPYKEKILSLVIRTDIWNVEDLWRSQPCRISGKLLKCFIMQNTLVQTVFFSVVKKHDWQSSNRVGESAVPWLDQ
jgi:hypothetical protein